MKLTFAVVSRPLVRVRTVVCDCCLELTVVLPNGKFFRVASLPLVMVERLSYNTPRSDTTKEWLRRIGMRLSAPRWLTATGFMVLYGCALFQAAPSVIYRDDSLTVTIEPNPAGEGQSQREKLEPRVTPQQLAAILRGLYAQKKGGFLQSVIGLQPELVFREDELSLVAGEIQMGLRQASSQERVAFQLWRPRGKGREETRGSIYLRGSLLSVTLSKFRAFDRMDYAGAEGGSGEDFELLFEPSEAVVQRQPGFAARWLAADRPEVIIDLQRFRHTSPNPAPPNVP